MPPRLWLTLGAMLMAQAICLFGGAGTVRWPAGWIYILFFFACIVAVTWALAKNNPALLAERMKGMNQPGQPLWDKILAGSLQVVWFGWLVLMGLDARFGWSAMPDWLEWVGMAGLIAGFWIVHLTFRENNFLSPAVRIQSERGHRVVSTGPYAVIRHPMYAGATFIFAGTALALGSWWGLAAGMLLELSVASRIIGEERVLRADLPGYADYTRYVRYRLIPFVW